MAEFILKDWYGKEKSFDRETVYFQDAEGNLMPFTHGTGNPTLEDLNVTENGNYTPSEGVDGFGSVSVNVPDIPAVVQPLEVTENGTYTAPDWVDGYSPVVVNVATASADVRYVTFMSYDGLVEYGKKAVAVGDDCADPIARGIFAKPTRESDVQYNYTFYGWATEPNGGADTNWNKAITEDKTVYANFSKAVRYYTITYYDSDGTTVLKTESLAYGAMPSYVPTKANFVFKAWEPIVTSVTGNASYAAVWEEKVTFATASWDKIAEISESGKASQYFALGDERNIQFTISGKKYNVPFVIVHFGDTECEDGSIAGITLLSKYALVCSYFGSNINTVGIGWLNGWENAPIRTNANSTAINYIPSDVRTHIKYVKKLSAPAGYKTTSDANTETIDRIWIPSITEYGESYSQTTKNQGFRFSGIGKVGKQAYSMGSTGAVSTSHVNHGTRSAHMANGSNFGVAIMSSNMVTYEGSSYFRMGFCI